MPNGTVNNNTPLDKIRIGFDKPDELYLIINGFNQIVFIGYEKQCMANLAYHNKFCGDCIIIKDNKEVYK